jgi:triacylglycerol lipase
MKSTTLISSIASLLAASIGLARNPQPLKFRSTLQTLENPIGRVVLVHGFLENGATFRTLKKRLEQQNIQCIVPKMRPSDGRGGLEGLAQRLKQDIEAAYGTEQPISIVAFSMGGLVSRYYLQNLDGAARCDKLFTISSPHQGTGAAWCYPTKGAEQMRPGSQFLTDLNKTQSKLEEMPVVSYRTPMDLIILPPTNSVWERAENLEFNVILHPLMLSSNAVLTDIEQRLLR